MKLQDSSFLPLLYLGDELRRLLYLFYWSNNKRHHRRINILVVCLKLCWSMCNISHNILVQNVFNTESSHLRHLYPFLDSDILPLSYGMTLAESLNLSVVHIVSADVERGLKSMLVTEIPWDFTDPNGRSYRGHLWFGKGMGTFLNGKNSVHVSKIPSLLWWRLIFYYKDG